MSLTVHEPEGAGPYVRIRVTRSTGAGNEAPHVTFYGHSAEEARNLATEHGYDARPVQWVYTLHPAQPGDRDQRTQVHLRHRNDLYRGHPRAILFADTRDEADAEAQAWIRAQQADSP